MFEAQNRDTILGSVRRFSWQNGWFLLKQNRGTICAGLTRFLDKVVVPWVVLLRRGAIFTGAARFCCHCVLFKCFSSFFKEKRERFKREKLGKSKEITLGLRVFD